MITYCIPTYNRQDLLVTAINAAISGTIAPDKFIIVDNSALGKARNSIFGTEFQKSVTIDIIEAEENLGCSITWNMFMRDNEDYIIIANDDVAVHKDTILSLVSAATNNPDKPMFTGSGHSGNSFSLFLLRKWAWELLGEFDEQFKPAYFEDNDWHYRLKLLGLDFISLNEATFDHVGSGTLRALTGRQLEVHHKKFARNQDYYKAKWGDIPGKEIFTIPFNGRNKEEVLAELKQRHSY